MELWVFLGLVLVVGIVLLRRSRAGGTGSPPDGPPRNVGGEPINYGEFVSPRGTSPAAGVNAPWFGRDHTDSGDHSAGAGD